MSVKMYDREQIRQFSAAGLKADKIAEKLGTQPRAIRRVLQIIASFERKKADPDSIVHADFGRRRGAILWALMNLGIFVHDQQRYLSTFTGQLRDFISANPHKWWEKVLRNSNYKDTLKVLDFAKQLGLITQEDFDKIVSNLSQSETKEMRRWREIKRRLGARLEHIELGVWPLTKNKEDINAKLVVPLDEFCDFVIEELDKKGRRYLPQLGANLLIQIIHGRHNTLVVNDAQLVLEIFEAAEQKGLVRLDRSPLIKPHHTTL